MSRMLLHIAGACLLAWLHLLPVAIVGFLTRSTDAMWGAFLAIGITTFVWNTKFELKTWRLWKNQTTVSIGNADDAKPTFTHAFTARDPWGEGKP
jgi:hypothetical protein